MNDGLTRLCVWVAVLLSLTPVRPVSARPADDAPAPLLAPLGDQEAQQLAEQALSAYEGHQYQDAARLYLRAHVLRPDPTLLYNIARCHEHLGQREAALEFYGRFTGSPGADEELRARARARAAAIQRAEPPHRNRRAMDLRLLIPGLILFGGGATGLTVGAVLDGTTASREQILSTPAEFEKREAIAAARARGAQAVVAYSIGGAALLGGVVLLGVALARRLRTPAEPRLSVALLPLPAGGVLALRGPVW